MTSATAWERGNRASGYHVLLSALNFDPNVEVVRLLNKMCTLLVLCNS